MRLISASCMEFLFPIRFVQCRLWYKVISKTGAMAVIKVGAGERRDSQRTKEGRHDA